ncbi:MULTISPECIES: c-type cytochrome biogenesis protein CcmI [unclassified Rhizobium]|uniref:c-type cytochrome biogenesis protein CcmI n=1 Tax=unclassified Rhizobium TaxID=2613769 RepID=UPI000CDF3A2E|nr:MULTISPECIES: c-type cytochrome biogenesis protein CcmI [Rhizobium]AVA20838.1 cytochrome-c-type biogenesis protein CcmI/CycH [Rhizobium sp. NXC24]UWU22051.1 c-type cytochrome biogenesis protein CcmI [Rhizobium tropici]
MLFWILVAVLTAVVGAILLSPLLRGAKVADDGRAGEAAVYRDQLRELDRDLAGGLISQEEAGYARAEIGRRLLAVSGAGPSAAKVPARGHYLSQAFIIVLLPVVCLCLYLVKGNPGLPSQPLQARLEHPGNDLAISIVKVEQHLAQQPDDGKGWEVLAPIYLKTGRIGDAELAYRNVIRLLGPNAERLGNLGEVLIMKADGIVTAEARSSLQQSLALDADNPRALFYLALALEQDGKAEQAKTAFEALAKQSPPDAPWMAAVNDHIVKNGGAADTATADSANANAPGNPTSEQVAAADAMNSGDRQQMIRGMVESLDAKLKDDPRNFEGWMRLIRSYAVLKDTDRAVDALKRSLKTFPADGGEGKQLLALAKELGLPTEVTQQ